MKSEYNTIPSTQGESKSNGEIPESGVSRISKKHQVLINLVLVTIGFLMGRRTGTHHAGLPTNKESMEAAQLVGFKEDSKEHDCLVCDTTRSVLECSGLPSSDNTRKHHGVTCYCPDPDHPGFDKRNWLDATYGVTIDYYCLEYDKDNGILCRKQDDSRIQVCAI